MWMGLRKSVLMVAVVMAAAVARAGASEAARPVEDDAQNGAPVCPYGYYGYAPFQCAPYGYYGPEWFTDGVFVGAGPWHQGTEPFWGHVDRRLDPRFGYRGPFPAAGPYVEQPDHFHNFHGSQWIDDRGAYHTQAQYEQYERVVRTRPVGM